MLAALAPLRGGLRPSLTAGPYRAGSGALNDAGSARAAACAATFPVPPGTQFTAGRRSATLSHGAADPNCVPDGATAGSATTPVTGS